MTKKRKVESLKVRKSIEDQFKAEAKMLFPKECYAICLGTVDAKGRRSIEFLIFPDIVGDYSTEDLVMVQDQWWEHARRVAKLKDMEVIGDIHSHCYEADEEVRDASPSMQDWDRFDRSYVQGICAITRVASGRLRASLRWWDAPPDLRVEVE